jgi:hypothetical protein
MQKARETAGAFSVNWQVGSVIAAVLALWAATIAFSWKKRREESDNEANGSNANTAHQRNQFTSPSYSLHGRDSLAGMVQTSVIT